MWTREVDLVIYMPLCFCLLAYVSSRLCSETICCYPLFFEASQFLVFLEVHVILSVNNLYSSPNLNHLFWLMLMQQWFSFLESVNRCSSVNLIASVTAQLYLSNISFHDEILPFARSSNIRWKPSAWNLLYLPSVIFV